MFVLSNAFTFMSFSARGGAGDDLPAVHHHPGGSGYLFLGAVLSITLIGLPLVYIGSIMLVLWRLDKDLHSKALRSLGRLLCRIKPWLMVDVFLIGVLISLVKLMGMADIKMGLSFWAFVGYTLLLIKMISSLDRMWLWQRLFGPTAARELDPEESALSCGLVGCHICGALNEQDAHSCVRCGDHLHSRKPGGLNRTWALLITSVILYVPANLYPIMDTVFLGMTALDHHGRGGAAVGHGLLPHCRRHLLRERGGAAGEDPGAAVALLRGAARPGDISPRQAQTLSHDRICGALVDDRRLRGGHPGRSHPARQSDDHLPWPCGRRLCRVVLVTMVAAMSFDSRLIWDLQQGERERE